MNRRVVPEVVAVAALFAVAAVPGQAVARIAPSGWGNYHLVRVALMGAGIGLTVAVIYDEIAADGQRAEGPSRILRGLLVVHASLVLVLLGKYLVGEIPSTWSHDAIQYYSMSESLGDMYKVDVAFTPPVTTPIYPPGLFAAADLLEALVGEGRDVLRLLVSASTLASAGMIGAITARKHGVGWGLAGGALFLAVFPQLTWSGAPTKPEYLAVAFSLAGLATLCDPTDGVARSTRRVAVGGLLFGLALVTKFTVLAGLAGVLGYLALERRWSDLVVLTVAVAVIVGGTYLGFSYATNGGIVFFTLLANAAPPDFERIFRFGLMDFGQSFFVILCIAVAVFYAHDGDRRREEPLAAVVALGLLVAVAFGVVSTGRPGSSANYFLESAALGTLLVAVALPPHLEAPRRPPAGGPLLLLLIGTFLFLHLPSQAALLARDVPEGQIPRDVLEQVDIGPGQYMLSDPRFVSDLREAGITPLVVDGFQLTMMIDQGLVDDSVVTKPIRAGRVPAALLEENPAAHTTKKFGRRNHSKEVISLIQNLYRCQTIRDPGLTLCRWKSRQAGREAPPRQQ